MGGFISAELSIRRPELVERLLLLSAAGISQSTVARSPLLAFARVVGLLSRQSEAQRRATAARPALRHAALNIIARHPTLLRPDLVHEGLLKGAGKPGFYGALRACLVYDFRDRLPEIGCPTLIVWGREDMIIPVGDADDYERLIPGARKLLLEDTGHVPMVERPPTFNAIVQEFLEHEVAAGELEASAGQITPGPAPRDRVAQARPAMSRARSHSPAASPPAHRSGNGRRGRRG